jgi:hypothetical protein
MGTIPVNIEDQHDARVATAFRDEYDYDNTKEVGETVVEFISRHLLLHVKEVVLRNEAKQLEIARSAAYAAIAQADKATIEQAKTDLGVTGQ